MGRQLIGLLITGLSAVIIGGFGTPIVWLLLRIVGLTDAIILWLGQYYGLMVGGGLLIGAIIGVILAAVVAQTLQRSSKARWVASIIGGAIGGYATSLMFFPIVVIL